MIRSGKDTKDILGNLGVVDVRQQGESVDKMSEC